MNPATEIASRYIQAWNETDAQRRGALVAEVFARDASYVDPMASVAGHDGIETARLGGAVAEESSDLSHVRNRTAADRHQHARGGGGHSRRWYGHPRDSQKRQDVGQDQHRPEIEVMGDHQGEGRCDPAERDEAQVDHGEQPSLRRGR